MIPRSMALAVSLLTVAVDQEQRPVFRARLDSVSVNVSVKNRNVAVAGLKPEDFRLFDNGVLQTVERVSIEGVPIDLTVFLDTSPSFSGRMADLRTEIQAVAGLLREGDRIRLLALSNEIDEVFGWTSAGRPLDLSALRVARISSVYDGLAAALLHQPGLDRRHLVVAMTDGVDYNSAVSSQRVLDIASRVEGVLHLLMLGMSAGPLPHAPTPALMRGPDELGDGRLKDAAERTGGRMHDPILRLNVVQTFKQIFDDFRTSYILRFTPTGVKPDGWHDLKVEVPSQPRATVRARRGYVGG